MRKATLFGKDIYLTEKQWSQLIGRFDVDKTKQAGYSAKFRISMRCFCDNFPCSRCPFYKVKWGDLDGCARIVNYLCGTSDWAFDLGMSSVSWYEVNDKKARKQIQKVYTALSCMEQVKYVKEG